MAEFDRIPNADFRCDVLPDGIYFGLPNDEYHADPALGSSNIRDLLKGGPTYWWNSALNPNRKSKRTRALDFGSAAHVAILEGMPTFHEQFACQPDPDGALVTLAHMQQFLKDRHENRIPRTKAEAGAQCRLVDPTVRILDDELKAIEDSGRTLLSADDYARVTVGSAIITANPELRTAFVGGIAEVSVFWTVQGVRLKCRFDYLKPKAITDLKTLGNSMGRPFPQACIRSIADRAMPVQAALYLMGRGTLYGFAQDGRVFGDHDPRLFRRCVESQEHGWAWVFLQSVDAPLTWGTTLLRQNPILTAAGEQVGHAIGTFKQYFRDFGLDHIWLSSDPVTELDQSELPGWYGMTTV